MDKLELDVRVARLERRSSHLTVLVALMGAALACMLFFALVGHADVSPAYATVLPMPTVAPAPVATPAPMFPPAPPADGTMAVLHDQLATLRDLRNQDLITEDEWHAKKNKLLSAPVKASDLRSDLERVRDLVDQEAICEGERDTLKKKLLEIEE